MARDDLLERALLETNLKLGPQGSALRQLLSELAGQYTRTRRVNASNERGIVQATREARPEVQGAFDQALSSSQAQRAALGVGAADPQAAAFERRVGEQKGNALVDLTSRATRATEGRVFANQQARDEYLGGKQKIVGQLLDLARQSGDLTASTLGKLEDEAADRDIDRDRLTETQRHNRASEATARRNADRAARGARGMKLASQEQHAAARDGISQAIALVKRQQQLGATSRAEIIQLLSTGRPAQKVKVDGKEVSLPAIPRLPADFVRAATNMVFDGSLSRGDVQRLHNRRLRLRSLGFPIRPATPPRDRLNVLQQGAGAAVAGR